MKAILYARVSTAGNRCRACGKGWTSQETKPICPQCQSEDIEKSQDVENQLGVLRQICKEKGWAIAREFVDRKSGKNEDREQYQKMMEFAKKTLPPADGKPGLVFLFWSLDRFGRGGIIPTLQALETLSKAGHEWMSHQEQYLTTAGPFREAIIAIIATLAKMERERIRERVRAGIDRSKLTGTKSGKAHGRPRKEIDGDLLKKLVAEKKSGRAIAKELGVSLSTIQVRMGAKRRPKAEPVKWSGPVWGKFDQDGVFEVDEDGKVVIRYDMGTGEPWCINHQVKLGECSVLHAIGGTV